MHETAAHVGTPGAKGLIQRPGAIVPHVMKNERDSQRVWQHCACHSMMYLKIKVASWKHRTNWLRFCAILLLMDWFQNLLSQFTRVVTEAFSVMILCKPLVRMSHTPLEWMLIHVIVFLQFCRTWLDFSSRTSFETPAELLLPSFIQSPSHRGVVSYSHAQ